MSKTLLNRSKRESIIRKTNLEGNKNYDSSIGLPGTPSSAQMNDQARRTIMEVDERKNAQPKIQDPKEHRQDMIELQLMWEKNVQQMKELNLAKVVQAKWDRYMRCDGSPDPVNQKEINTYISLRHEDTSHNDAESVLNDSQLDLQLIEELKLLMLDSPLDELCEEERVVYQKTIEDLQKLIMSKLDMATLHVMRDATVLANKETGNLQHAVMIDDIALCIWGNIMKNPRIRLHEFPEIQFTFDIPRIIALSDCAVRVLTTKFDHYSATSKTIIPRLKKVAEPAETDIKEEKKEEEEQEGEDEERTKELKEEETEEKEELYLTAASSEAFKEEKEGEEEEDQEISEDYFQDPPTPEPIEWDDFDEDVDVVDLRGWGVLGCVYHFNLLQLPPQPKFVGSWTITQLVDPPEICYLEYTADSWGEGGKETKKDERPPIAISVVLPGDTLFLEQPLTAHWDYGRKLWTVDGLSDFSYSEEARMLSFKTTHFGTFCMLQDIHINMPFLTWEIRPHKLNSAVFTIKSTLIEIQIEIKDEFCCLSGPKDRPELNSIRNKWVTPAELFVMMKKAGVNFFPSEDSIKFVSIPNKHPVIEERMYQQMAMTASAMAYSWSKWNSKIGESNEIIFQGAEVLEDEPILEEKWGVFLANKRHVMQLKFKDLDEFPVNDIKRDERLVSVQSSFNRIEDEALIRRISSKTVKAQNLMRKSSATRMVPKRKVKEESKTPKEQFLETFNLQNSTYKSNMYHLMPTFASENGLARVNSTSFQFISSVHKLLTATKVLTYS